MEPQRGEAGKPRVSLDKAEALSQERAVEVVELDEALNRLATMDPRKSQIVELRYFGGLSAEETAEVLAVSAITVKREWLKAKAWLHREIKNSNE